MVDGKANILTQIEIAIRNHQGEVEQIKEEDNPAEKEKAIRHLANRIASETGASRSIVKQSLQDECE